MIFSSLVMSEWADSLGVCLSSANISGFKISDSRNRIRKSTRHISLNFTISIVQTCWSDLHEISIRNSVTNCVFRNNWVNWSFRFPVFLCHITIVDVLIVTVTVICSGAALGAFDVTDVHDIFYRLCRERFRTSTLDVVDFHLVANELVWLRLDILKWLKFVIRVQRIWRLLRSNWLKAVNTWLRAFNILIS